MGGSEDGKVRPEVKRRRARANHMRLTQIGLQNLMKAAIGTQSNSEPTSFVFPSEYKVSTPTNFLNRLPAIFSQPVVVANAGRRKAVGILMEITN